VNTILYTFAWKNLTYLLGFSLAFPAIGHFGGWDNAVTFLVFIPMVFAALWVLEGMMYYRRWSRRRDRDGHAPALWDEREEAVYYKALTWGFGSSWVALVLAVGWFIRSYLEPGGEEITMVSLSVTLGACFCVLVLFFSLSVIVQKRGEEGPDA
jgi:hypothetical protein